MTCKSLAVNTTAQTVLTLLLLAHPVPVRAQQEAGPDPQVAPAQLHNSLDLEELETLPPGSIDPLLNPDSAGVKRRPAAKLEPSTLAATGLPAVTLLPGRTYEVRDPSNKIAYTYSMSSDPSAYRLINISVATQKSGKINIIRKVIAIDEMADHPARYTAERLVNVEPNAKSLVDTIVDVAGFVLDVLGKVCNGAEDFVKVLAKYRDHAPAWLRPSIDELVSHAPPNWTGKEVTKLVMPGGAHPLTQRLIAEVIRLFGKDYAARDRALLEIAATHLVVTGQAKDSPSRPYTAERALMLEHTVGMARMRDTRWAQALASAITAQYR